jgi:hypothetical protein
VPVHRLQPQRGRSTRNFDHPDWGPLIELAPEHVEDFMWMFEVELENGVALHAYKHWETRRYLHLDHAGRAYVYLWNDDLAADDDGRYEQVDPAWLLELVVDRDRSATFVRQNAEAEFRRTRWARSASKHRISRRSIRFVIERCRLRYTEPPPPEAPSGATPRFLFLGDDQQGRAVEVMAVEKDDQSLLVIHAMELRDRYRLDYEEAKRWQR